MRRLLRPLGVGLGSFVALAFFATSCSDRAIAPNRNSALSLVATRFAAASLSTVRISEFHYDNSGSDTGERVEVSFPTGMALTGWQLVLYNGTGGAAYTTTNLSTGTTTACLNGRSVVVLSYPTDGIQNGSPDGMALVGPTGVAGLLSYEGSFTAVGGAADGMPLPDIGVAEAGTTPVGFSLQRGQDGQWKAPAANTFSACNDTEPDPAAEVKTVIVTPATATLVQGTTQAFSEVALDADNQPIAGVAFSWSSDGGAVSVAANGVASALLPGDVTITATTTNNIHGAAQVRGTAVVHVAPLPSTRITELHYDNAGTDAGEAIEVEALAGTDLGGWSLVLYNGSDGAVYDTKLLTGVIANRCNGRGVTVASIPGLQNGSPDAVALVDPSGNVVEFLSYEGAMTATDGAAAGKTSTDIGVFEPSNTPGGQSLQRRSDGFWLSPAIASFGRCNEGDVPPPPPPPIVITELMADPFRVAPTFGEWFEVYNPGTEVVDLNGWSILSTGQPSHVIATNVVVPPGGFIVLGRDNNTSRNGGVNVSYNYFTGSSTIFLDAVDELSLRDPYNQVVDVVKWTNTSTMVKGVSRALRDLSADNSDVTSANWAYSTVKYGDGDFGTPGAPNGSLSDSPPVVPNMITFTGRFASDAPLPVGFEDQLFATLRSTVSDNIETSFTWQAVNPDIATIDADGVMHANAAGSATFRATADVDGTTATFTLPMIVATASTTARYGNNAEFGEPSDGDASDDYIIHRTEYTSSFNKNRNIPNWVSYDLEQTHIQAGQDRCDCFTYDPLLPFTHYTTADYTGAGAIAGFGIDRGHLARSFDRTSGALDNARTFYFSNIIPQASDNNQGPWANFENYLGSLAQDGLHEVYVIAGASGSQGTVKNEGLITIPAWTWKVAVIMPRDRGLADVHGYRDLEAVAIIIPNRPGVRSSDPNDWKKFVTTVNAVEALSGYDVLSLLQKKIENVVEAGMQDEMALVDDLVAAKKLSPGNGNSLTSKLEAAAASIDRGHNATAINQLEAFLNELDAMERSRRLSAADASTLRNAIQALIASVAS